MSAHIQAWCRSCGMVRTDYEPLPFCRARHPARRMEPLPKYHSLVRGGVSPSGHEPRQQP